MSGFLEEEKNQISYIIKYFFSFANNFRHKGLSLKDKKVLTMNDNIVKFLDG